MGHMKSSPPKTRHAPKETPTRPSMQAVRLAEEERIASTSVGEREEVSQARRRDEAESGVVAAAARVAPERESAASHARGQQRPPPVPGGAVRARPRSDAASEVSQVARRIEKQVPRMLVGMKDISKFPIDPRSAFLLGYVDGSLSVEEIIDLCAMPASEALELVDRLARLGVIVLG